ncbi:MFS transporter [Micromonospora globbae]|uniref:MFS transporter n=1 Tax=Micromonospora globbae TaxID=1894969 RepID=UPI003448F0C3
MLAPLRYGAFRYLAAGRLVNMLGNGVAPIALAFAVLDLTGSVRDLGLVVGARSLMTVLFVLFGGVAADRIPRRLVLVGSNALGALTQAAVAALVLTGTATIPLLLALSAANGIVSALSQPASAAATPQTVPPELIQPANALIRLGINAGMIGGAALGGLLVAAVGPGWGLAIDALTFAVAAMAFTGVRVAAPSGKSTRTSVVADLREGWTEFTARTWVWVVVLGFMILNAALAGGVNVLGPAVADDTIGRSAWGVVLAAETAGMVVGGLIALRIRVRRLLLLGVACMFAESFLLLGLALAPTIVVLLAAAAMVGIAVEQFAVAWDTSIAQHVPADRLGPRLLLRHVGVLGRHSSRPGCGRTCRRGDRHPRHAADPRHLGRASRPWHVGQPGRPPATGGSPCAHCRIGAGRAKRQPFGRQFRHHPLRASRQRLTQRQHFLGAALSRLAGGSAIPGLVEYARRPRRWPATSSRTSS